MNRPLTHLECDDDTSAIYAKPVAEVTEDEEEYVEPNEASNSSQPPLFAAPSR